jgi:hypothetical protein
MFAIDVRHWKTIAEFKNHLANHPPTVASWARGVVIHHTWKPGVSDWRGAPTIEGIKNYYVAKGWTAGPHLFVIGNPPDPSTAGIWQMTPLNMRGIHAGRYNTTHWGIEVVGNYDVQPWGELTHDLVLGAAGALLQWQKIPATYNTVKGHRETGSPKTCPGKLVNMDSFRYDLAALLGGR